MKSREQKGKELKDLEAKLPDSQITIFTSFARMGEKGLSVAQMTELKRALRAAHSEYVVTKKTLIDRALRQAQDKPSEGKTDVYGMQGSLGLVIGPPRGAEGETGNEEPYSIAKKVYEFARKNPALQFFGALVNGRFISKEQFLEMARMPSREVLIGRLFGMMRYPISGLAIVLNQISKQKEVV